MFTHSTATGSNVAAVAATATAATTTTTTTTTTTAVPPNITPCKRKMIAEEDDPSRGDKAAAVTGSNLDRSAASRKKPRQQNLPTATSSKKTTKMLFAMSTNSNSTIASCGNSSVSHKRSKDPQAASVVDSSLTTASATTTMKSIFRARSVTAAATRTSRAISDKKITPSNLLLANAVAPIRTVQPPAVVAVKDGDIVDINTKHKRANTSRCATPMVEQRRADTLGAAATSMAMMTTATTAPKILGDIEQVDEVFRRAAAGAFITWALLLTGTLGLYFRSHYHKAQQQQQQSGDGYGYYNSDDADGTAERRVPQTAFFVLLASAALQMTPIVLARMRSSNSNNTNKSISGVLMAALVIQGIALSTNALLGWGPRVVVNDPVTGSPVFLIRWCEWIPLAGFMTLLAESADISVGPNAWREPIIFSLCQLVSTLCGIVLPFCQTTTQWAIVMFISCVTFVMIFPRVYSRWQAFRKAPMGRSSLEQEYYDRRKFAYYLMLLCSIFWSILVALYAVNLIIHMALPASHWLRFPSLAMSCDTIADVLAKVIYTRIIVEAHQAIFALDLRTARQLNELKQLMSMLWVSSSDVIVISSKQNNHCKATMLSPSFLTLVGANPPTNTSTTTTLSPSFLTLVGANPPTTTTQAEDCSIGSGKGSSGDSITSKERGDARALVLETDRGKVQSAYYVNTSTMSDGLHPESIDGRIMLGPEDLNHNAVQQALRITNATWTATDSDNDDEPLRALSIVPCDDARRKDGGKVMCEMKISRHTHETAVAVVRDVTERYRRFEAESRVHAEIIARQRDMHTANRFTRHEVKNGLLASIELCRTLGQSLSDLREMLKKGSFPQNSAATQGNIQNVLQQSSALLDGRTMKSLLDLDGELHGVLDTVLAEVMAREVVHGVYQPRLEGLDVPAMLVLGLRMSKERIPLTVKGGSMPKLLLDAQLIGHIHRNALSNACKYGKQGGSVRSMVEFDSAKHEFRLEVINEPGVGHATLLAMGETASEFVFAQGVRLQPHMNGKMENKLNSSGDGAWIMQKCATTMKGACSIKFTLEGTRFTFHCPAVPVARNSKPTNVNFVVPENVRAIGIDDSKIQRKLLARILTHVGVDPSKQLLLGESPEDVTELESTLMNLMDEHQSDKFLLIVDEHLDYDNLASKQQDGVYSGSLVMKQILEHMPQERLSRCLVLMRSANDSAVDIAMYTERTHGYFPKAIMQKDRTREILAPLWLERFPKDAL